MVGGYQYQKWMEEQNKPSRARTLLPKPESSIGLGIADVGMSGFAARTDNEGHGKGKGRETRTENTISSSSSSAAAAANRRQTRSSAKRNKIHFVDESEEEIDVKFFGPKSSTAMLPGWNHDVYLEDPMMPAGVSLQAQKICISAGRGCIVRIDLLEEAWRHTGERLRVDMFTDKATPVEEAKRRGLEILVTVPREDYLPEKRNMPDSMQCGLVCFGTSYIPFRLPVVDRQGNDFALPVKLKCLVVNDDYPFFPRGRPGDRDVRMWIGHSVLDDMRVSTNPTPMWTSQDDPGGVVPTVHGPRGRNRFSTQHSSQWGTWQVSCNDVYDELGNFVAEGETLDVMESEDDDLFADPMWW